MGIQGLLPQLRDITQSVHISKYKNKTVGIDGYVWLHRGVYSSCTDICMKSRVGIDSYVKYFINRINLLLKNKVIPFVVFDGGFLPQKLAKEVERKERREKNFNAGKAFFQQGFVSKAEQCFQKAVDITPTMAYQIIKVLKKMGVQYVVAPYEADAQLAYLYKRKRIDAVISEDSDLLVFGCRTVLFKMGPGGNCEEINLDDLQRNTTLRFANWTDEMFQIMCIFTGCDYVQCKGIGIKTAHSMVAKYRSNWKRAIQMMKLKTNKCVPKGYIEDFRKALLTFRHQTVFCPDRLQLVHLQTPESTDGLEFVGPQYDMKLARKVAKGLVHPESKKPISEHEKEEYHIVVDENNMHSGKPVPKKMKEKLNKTRGLLPITSFFAPSKSKKKKKKSTISPRPKGLLPITSFLDSEKENKNMKKKRVPGLFPLKRSKSDPLCQKRPSMKRKSQESQPVPIKKRKLSSTSKFFPSKPSSNEPSEVALPGEFRKAMKAMPNLAQPRPNLTSKETLQNFDKVNEEFYDLSEKQNLSVASVDIQTLDSLNKFGAADSDIPIIQTSRDLKDVEKDIKRKLKKSKTSSKGLLTKVHSLPETGKDMNKLQDLEEFRIDSPLLSLEDDVISLSPPKADISVLDDFQFSPFSSQSSAPVVKPFSNIYSQESNSSQPLSLYD